MRCLTFLTGLIVCCTMVSAADADPTDICIEHYTKLRMTAAAADDYVPMWDSNPDREKAIELLRAGKTEEGNAALVTYLKKNPVDARMHLYCAVSAMELKNWAQASKHLAVYHGLLASIGASASGTSKNDPIKVIAIQEEYDYLDGLSIESSGQSLIVNDNGTPVDAIECTVESESFIMYFDATIPMSYWSKVTGDAAEESQVPDSADPDNPPASPAPSGSSKPSETNSS